MTIRLSGDNSISFHSLYMLHFSDHVHGPVRYQSKSHFPEFVGVCTGWQLIIRLLEFVTSICLLCVSMLFVIFIHLRFLTDSRGWIFLSPIICFVQRNVYALPCRATEWMYPSIFSTCFEDAVTNHMILTNARILGYSDNLKQCFLLYDPFSNWILDFKLHS